MSTKNTLPENKINQAKTRLLLALFVAEEPVMRGKLNEKVVPSKEKRKDARVFLALVVYLYLLASDWPHACNAVCFCLSI